MLKFDQNNQDLVICRCEEVTEQEIISAIHTGAQTVDAVKRVTRSGMGLCQGRTCSLLIARLINQETGIPLDKLTPPKKRLPIRPLELHILSALDVDE